MTGGLSQWHKCRSAMKDGDMDGTSGRMFSLEEAAVAYAVAAEHMLGEDASFLESNTAVVPVFVSMLFQSLEISIKCAGIEAGLFSAKEARSRQNRSGHGIRELSALAVERLRGAPFEPIVTAMTFAARAERAAQFVREMICGESLEKTREAYASRRLGYGEVHEGDFALIHPIGEWVEAVKQTAVALPKTIDILSQWRSSTSASRHFAIWLTEGK